MSIEIHEVLRAYGELFDLDLNDHWDELTHKIENQLSTWLEDPQQKGERDQTALTLKTTLRFLAEQPKAQSKIKGAILHFQNEQEGGNRDFTHINSELPLTDEEVELMYESTGIWFSLPTNLVTTHWDLLRKMAVKFHDPHRPDAELEFDDLMGVAAEALTNAAQKNFESPRGDFRKFATQMIKDKIQSYKATRHPVPFKTRKKLERLRNARESTGKMGQDAESTAKLAEQSGIPDHELKGLYEIESIWGSGRMVDLGDKIEELEIPDLSPDALSLLIDHETSMRLSEVMTTLSSIQRNVILQIYFKDQSFRQAAENLKISLNVIKKHHRKALDRLKGVLD